MKAELAELNPALLEHILKRNPDSRFEQGEAMDECATRVLDGVMDIARKRPGERVLAITHGWAMDVIAREVRGLTEAAGLTVAAYGSYYKAGHSEAAGLPFPQVLDTALALGAPVIRVWAGPAGSAASASRASWASRPSR